MSTYHCSVHGKFSLKFCPLCPAPPYAAPEIMSGAVRISLTREELKLLLDYWPGDCEAMGDGDACLKPGEPKMQPVGNRILDKLNRAYQS